MIRDVRVFEVDYDIPESQSAYPFREMHKDANIGQGDDVRVRVEDGLIQIRRVNDD